MLLIVLYEYATNLKFEGGYAELAVGYAVGWRLEASRKYGERHNSSHTTDVCFALVASRTMYVGLKCTTHEADS